MAQTELIDDHVSTNQCQLAVDALLKHEQKRQEKLQETQLLPGREQNIWLVLTVKQMQPEKKLKPHKIPIVHPLVDPRSSSVCLITKDPQREYKNLLEEHKIKFISRVVGVEKLKGKFKAFEARRLLLKENDLFLADERVVPLLPKLLGSKFFQAKKQPIPVNLTRKDLKGELERAISSTYFHQNQGTCSSIKFGTLSQTSAQVIANLKAALPAIIKAVKGGWDNVQSLNIKTNSSASLPIWSCDLGLEEGGRWDGLDDVLEASDGEDEDEDEEDEEVQVVKERLEKSSKGKKRAVETEDEEPPKKKAKSSKPQDAKAVPEAPPPTSKAKSKTRKEETSTPSSPPAKPLKAKQKPQADIASSSAVPLTPSVKKKKARAEATDFFDDAEAASPAQVAPPPNTPAISKKKKSKVAEQTPVTSAIEKLADEVQAAPSSAPVALSGGDGEKTDKKPRHKKGKATLQDATSELVQENTEQQAPAESVLADGENKKKKKQKQKQSVEVAASLADAGAIKTPSSGAPSVSVEEIKQKLGASSSVEKKKEKAVKAKRSAKDALLGKKRL